VKQPLPQRLRYIPWAKSAATTPGWQSPGPFPPGLATVARESRAAHSVTLLCDGAAAAQPVPPGEGGGAGAAPEALTLL